MKVAAYCRVSTDRDDQANSFDSQRRYFREYILRQPGWELYEIYADEGITGTSTQKRTAFNQMIRDARQHRFDRILTKEVSRFSRNILDTISYTRDLKRLGIGVLFLSDGIDTMEPDAELRLSIMASIAQEESRKTSARVKWGQTRRMEQGVVFGRSMLGYDVKDGRMTVNPQGAEIVRLIFHKYVRERKGTFTIARELREAGIKTLRGSPDWRNTVILKILRNEKYCGDLKQKKTYTPDYLTHRKQYNHGQEEFVCIRNHHEPIIDRPLWEAAQEELSRRDTDGTFGSGHGNRYPLSGKIRCAGCGRCFVSRMRKRRDGTGYRTWRCASGAEGGHSCDVGYQFRDDAAMEMLRQTLAMLPIHREAAANSITGQILGALRAAREDGWERGENLRRELAGVVEKKKRMLDAFAAGSVSRQDMVLMNGEYDGKIARLTQALEDEKKRDSSLEALDFAATIQEKVCDIVYGRTATDGFCGNLLQSVTVFPDRRLEVRLRGLPGKWVFRLEQR